MEVTQDTTLTLPYGSYSIEVYETADGSRDWYAQTQVQFSGDVAGARYSGGYITFPNDQHDARQALVTFSNGLTLTIAQSASLFHDGYDEAFGFSPYDGLLVPTSCLPSGYEDGTVAFANENGSVILGLVLGDRHVAEIDGVSYVAGLDINNTDRSARRQLIDSVRRIIIDGGGNAEFTEWDGVSPLAQGQRLLCAVGQFQVFSRANGANVYTFIPSN